MSYISILQHRLDNDSINLECLSLHAECLPQSFLVDFIILEKDSITA